MNNGILASSISVLEIKVIEAGIKKTVLEQFQNVRSENENLKLNYSFVVYGVA